MASLAGRSAKILRAAVSEFGDRAFATSSFQTQGMPLLHLISVCAPDLPVWFIDTGFHFPETLEFRDRVVAAMRLNLQILRASPLTMEEAAALRDAGKSDPCCEMLKVGPMTSLLERSVGGCWISGVRRDQTKARRVLGERESTPQGVVRVHPMIDWVDGNVDGYIEAYGLPRHPLWYDSYESIGCAPCTAKGRKREGRWPGMIKEGCGIHGLIRGRSCEG